jgi:hypothetical protein
VRWACVGMLVLVAALPGARAETAPEAVPDAQMLLDLDLLTQPEARDRDFMRRLSLFERLRLLELFRMLEETPAAAARRPSGGPAGPPASGVPEALPPSGAPATPPPPRRSARSASNVLDAAGIRAARGQGSLT